MKNLYDVERHQNARVINRIAQMAVDKDLSTDMLKSEIDNQFLNESRANKKIIYNQIVQKCFSNAWLIEERVPVVQKISNNNDSSSLEVIHLVTNNIRNCFALQLSERLIKIINSNSFKLLRGKRFSEDFFNESLNALSSSKVDRKVRDKELFVIYVKQLCIILRNSRLFYIEEGNARIATFDFDESELYIVLFSSFWNAVKWEDIFPSSPQLARELKGNRTILIDLILNAGERFSISDISNEFIQLTGLGNCNNMILISFLDFYFFTWMQHFNIINYLKGTDEDSVSVELTDHGRGFLEQIRELQ